MWNLKYDTNKLIYETETDAQTYLSVSCHGGWGVGEGWFHPQLGRANPDTICSSKSQEREERLHILTKTAYVLKQRLPPPKPSGHRKVEKIQNTQFSDVGRENTLIPDNGGGDTISEQVECLYIAAQVCTRGKEMTQSLMIYYIHVSISPTANKRKRAEEGGRIMGCKRQSLI